MTENQYREACSRIHRDLKQVIDYYIYDMGDPWTMDPSAFKQAQYAKTHLDTFFNVVSNSALKPRK